MFKLFLILALLGFSLFMLITSSQAMNDWRTNTDNSGDAITKNGVANQVGYVLMLVFSVVGTLGSLWMLWKRMKK
jgi:hypothetical protein